MQAARARLVGDGAVVAGVSSGTSADGIDVALARVRATNHGGALVLEPPEALAFSVLPWPAGLGERVRAALGGEPCGLREAALLSRDLGRAFGAAVREEARARGVVLDLVGSHGQTVWHHDGLEPSGAATLQLGDGDFVAEEAGAPVVCDFRARDIAAGGEGAPLTPLVDGVLFARAPRPFALLNLGGIGNLTWLGAAGELLAFDTGPANRLLDGLARALLDEDCDRDGKLALAGAPDEAFVAELLAHPFVRRAPPKSTGRDTFGPRWLEEMLELARARGLLERGPADLFASATHAVAATVAAGLARAPARPAELIVAGGGAANPALLAALRARTGLAVRTSAAFGVDPRAREALAFALLAAAAALEIPLSHPGATGARAGRVLGKLCPVGNPGSGPG